MAKDRSFYPEGAFEKKGSLKFKEILPGINPKRAEK